MTHVAERLQGPLGITLVGAGEVAERQCVRALHAVCRARLVLFADADEERRRGVADRYGIVQHLTRANTGDRRDVAEVTEIITPATAHSHALEALEKTVRITVAPAVWEAGR